MLSPLKGQRKKRDFVVYDMEWIPGSLEIRLVGLHDGQRYRSWEKIDDFLNAVLVRDNHKKWFYAHYGGMADSIFLLEKLVAKEAEGYKVEASFSGSSAIIIHVTKGTYSWHFIDSFWLLRDKLANIGDKLGLPKLGEGYFCKNFPHCGHFNKQDEPYLEPCACGHGHLSHPRRPSGVGADCGCDGGHHGDEIRTSPSATRHGPEIRTSPSATRHVGTASRQSVNAHAKEYADAVRLHNEETGDALPTYGAADVDAPWNRGCIECECDCWRGDDPSEMCVFWAPMGELKTYNERDCLILHRAISAFEDTILQAGGQLQMTIASCAMFLFRAAYLPETIRTSPAVNEAARLAYTSSRVEVFQTACPSPAFLADLRQAGVQRCPVGERQHRVGHATGYERQSSYSWSVENPKTVRPHSTPSYKPAPFGSPNPLLSGTLPTDIPIGENCRDDWACACPRCTEYARRARAFYFDINSSFPYSMTFPCPGNVRRLHNGRLPKEGELYIADVTVTVPDMYLPPLPYRHKGRVFFPVGTWRSWFSNVDIELLLKHGGRVEKVHSSIEFEPQTFLRGYSEDIYAKRRSSKTAYDKLVWKYLLNSLYGKFAERREKTSMLLHPKSTDCPHEVKHRCFDWPSCEHARAGQECNLCIQMLFPGCFIVTGEAELAHECVPMSVQITSQSRAILYEFLYEAVMDVYYCDSISGDRTVVLRSPEGRTEIAAVEELWGRVPGVFSEERGKQFLTPEPGWEALAMDKDGKQGWFPLSRLIRHKSGKEMWRISNKDGQTEVTADHGVMTRKPAPPGRTKVEPGPVYAATPETFVADGANFITLDAQPPTGLQEVVDLWEHVKEASWPSNESGPNGDDRPLVRRFKKDGDFVRLTGLAHNGRRTDTKFRRYYERNSPEMFSLLRVLAAFISEGSASIRGVTTTRDMFTISQNNREWLDPLAADMETVVTGGHFPVADVGYGMWAIRAGSAGLSCFFAALGGAGSEGKKLPSFMYELSKVEFEVFWDKILEGDGHIIKSTGQVVYTTKSQTLAAGLSYLLSQHGIEHAIAFRDDKTVWSLITRPTGSKRNRKTTHTRTRAAKEGEYVYDLSVEGANTFVDGIGRVLLHNTDSVVTTCQLPTDDKTLGMLKQEYFVLDGGFIACKIYEMEVAGGKEKDAEGREYLKYAEKKVKAKGFSRMTYSKLVDVKEGVDIQLMRMTRIRELYRGKRTAPEENLVHKRLVQACMTKRCMLPDGQSRPWTLDEIEHEYMDLSVGIKPPVLEGDGE